MAWYRAGTVTVANGSPTVTGVGTDFVANAQIGQAFLGPDGKVYEIAQVEAAGQIVLSAPYLGGSGGGQGYAIMPTSSFARDLALGAAQLLNTFASVRDSVGQGLFPDGSVAAPAIRFGADQDTGFRRYGANAMSSVSAGVDRVIFEEGGGVTCVTAKTANGAVRGMYLYADASGTADSALDFGSLAMPFSGRISSRTLTANESEMTLTAFGPVAGTGRFRLFTSAPGAAYCRLQLGSAANPNAGAIMTATATGTQGVMTLETSGQERARIDDSGHLLVGTTVGDQHRICKSVGQGGTILLIRATAEGLNTSSVFAGVHGYTPSGTSAAQYLGNSTETNRSLNASGTLNASGADYAEYMTKAAGCGTIAKGDVCGVDINGHLTKTWADAISFVIKSTDPSYVGGDTWGQSAGPRPEGPGKEPAAPIAPPADPASEDEADVEAWRAIVAAYPGQLAAYQSAHAAWTDAKVAYDTALPAWEAALEAERQKVDRIAFSGQVPVNVTGDFAVGDYLIAAASGAGIKAVAVPADTITFDQYRRRLGKVWAVRDGRAWVDVQHG
jgi:hypothetical protein